MIGDYRKKRFPSHQHWSTFFPSFCIAIQLDDEWWSWMVYKSTQTGVGKSVLQYYFIHNRFPSSPPAIAPDFRCKTIDIDEQQIKLQGKMCYLTHACLLFISADITIIVEWLISLLLLIFKLQPSLGSQYFALWNNLQIIHQRSAWPDGALRHHQPHIIHQREVLDGLCSRADQWWPIPCSCAWYVSVNFIVVVVVVSFWFLLFSFFFCIITIVGTKSDLAPHQRLVSQKEGQALAQEIKAMAWIEVSTKNKEGGDHFSPQNPQTWQSLVWFGLALLNLLTTTTTTTTTVHEAFRYLAEAAHDPFCSSSAVSGRKPGCFVPEKELLQELFSKSNYQPPPTEEHIQDNACILQWWYKWNEARVCKEGPRPWIMACLWA